MKRHELTDEQWNLIEHLIPQKVARTGRPPRDRRLMLDGIFWILGTGAPWRDLPERFGSCKTVHRGTSPIGVAAACSPGSSRRCRSSSTTVA
jgi:transposase